MIVSACVTADQDRSGCLDGLLPARRRQRVKARTRKNLTSKYGPNTGQHPQKAQNHTVRTTIAFFDHGLDSRSRR
ncbi:hypothetical protein [Streptomyces sp. NPDC093149]|uniref:hypothetical protein n=1 Tax=Streptomyces sp. NPDC093149 TaxID=3366031 RepID=UPI0038169216